MHDHADVVGWDNLLVEKRADAVFLPAPVHLLAGQNQYANRDARDPSHGDQRERVARVKPEDEYSRNENEESGCEEWLAGRKFLPAAPGDAGTGLHVGSLLALHEFKG